MHRFDEGPRRDEPKIEDPEVPDPEMPQPSRIEEPEIPGSTQAPVEPEPVDPR